MPGILDLASSCPSHSLIRLVTLASSLFSHLLFCEKQNQLLPSFYCFISRISKAFHHFIPIHLSLVLAS